MFHNYKKVFLTLIGVFLSVVSFAQTDNDPYYVGTPTGNLPILMTNTFTLNAGVAANIKQLFPCSSQYVCHVVANPNNTTNTTMNITAIEVTLPLGLNYANTPELITFDALGNPISNTPITAIFGADRKLTLSFTHSLPINSKIAVRYIANVTCEVSSFQLPFKVIYNSTSYDNSAIPNQNSFVPLEYKLALSYPSQDASYHKIIERSRTLEITNLSPYTKVNKFKLQYDISKGVSVKRLELLNPDNSISQSFPVIVSADGLVGTVEIYLGALAINENEGKLQFREVFRIKGCNANSFNIPVSVTPYCGVTNSDCDAKKVSYPNVIIDAKNESNSILTVSITKNFNPSDFNTQYEDVTVENNSGNPIYNFSFIIDDNDLSKTNNLNISKIELISFNSETFAQPIDITSSNKGTDESSNFLSNLDDNNNGIKNDFNIGDKFKYRIYYVKNNCKSIYYFRQILKYNAACGLAEYSYVNFARIQPTLFHNRGIEGPIDINNNIWVDYTLNYTIFTDNSANNLEIELNFPDDLEYQGEGVVIASNSRKKVIIQLPTIYIKSQLQSIPIKFKFNNSTCFNGEQQRDIKYIIREKCDPINTFQDQLFIYLHNPCSGNGSNIFETSLINFTRGTYGYDKNRIIKPMFDNNVYEMDALIPSAKIQENDNLSTFQTKIALPADLVNVAIEANMKASATYQGDVLLTVKYAYSDDFNTNGVLFQGNVFNFANNFVNYKIIRNGTEIVPSTPIQVSQSNISNNEISILINGNSFIYQQGDKILVNFVLIIDKLLPPNYQNDGLYLWDNLLTPKYLRAYFNEDNQFNLEGKGEIFKIHSFYKIENDVPIFKEYYNTYCTFTSNLSFPKSSVYNFFANEFRPNILFNLISEENNINSQFRYKFWSFYSNKYVSKNIPYVIGLDHPTESINYTFKGNLYNKSHKIVNLYGDSYDFYKSYSPINDKNKYNINFYNNILPSLNYQLYEFDNHSNIENVNLSTQKISIYGISSKRFEVNVTPTNIKYSTYDKKAIWTISLLALNDFNSAKIYFSIQPRDISSGIKITGYRVNGKFISLTQNPTLQQKILIDVLNYSITTLQIEASFTKCSSQDIKDLIDLQFSWAPSCDLSKTYIFDKQVLELEYYNTDISTTYDSKIVNANCEDYTIVSQLQSTDMANAYDAEYWVNIPDGMEVDFANSTWQNEDKNISNIIDYTKAMYDYSGNNAVGWKLADLGINNGILIGTNNTNSIFNKIWFNIRFKTACAGNNTSATNPWDTEMPIILKAKATKPCSEPIETYPLSLQVFPNNPYNPLLGKMSLDLNFSDFEKCGDTRDITINANVTQVTNPANHDYLIQLVLPPGVEYIPTAGYNNPDRINPYVVPPFTKNKNVLTWYQTQQSAIYKIKVKLNDGYIATSNLNTIILSAKQKQNNTTSCNANCIIYASMGDVVSKKINVFSAGTCNLNGPSQICSSNSNNTFTYYTDYNAAYTYTWSTTITGATLTPSYYNKDASLTIPNLSTLSGNIGNVRLIARNAVTNALIFDTYIPVNVNVESKLSAGFTVESACQGLPILTNDPVTLKVTNYIPNTSYEFTIVGDKTFKVKTTAPTVNVNLQNIGKQSITMRQTIGTCKVNADPIEINVINFSVNISNGICVAKNDKATITITPSQSGTYTYKWFTPEGVEIAGNNTNVAEVNKPGIYKIELSSVSCITDKKYIYAAVQSINCFRTVTCGTVGATCLDCGSCLQAFQPRNNVTYVISGWVNAQTVGEAGFKIINKDNVGAETVLATIKQSNNQKIDDWTKIEGEFTIPQNAVNTKIELLAPTLANSNIYYDDIRVSPKDGSMKTYVFDPITLRLMAELDENNYASIYEYDDEGKLIRVKKETDRGIYTIQETRGNIYKK